MIARVISFSFIFAIVKEIPSIAIDPLYMQYLFKFSFNLIIYLTSSVPTFLISIILVFDKVSQLDLILAWLFSVSRYLHCYIRLSSNYVPYRGKIFQLSMLILIAWWIIFLYNIL